MANLDTNELSVVIAKALATHFSDTMQKKLGEHFSSEMRDDYIDNMVDQLHEGLTDHANSALECILDLTYELVPDDELLDNWLELIERRKMLDEVGAEMAELLVEHYRKNGLSSMGIKEELAGEWDEPTVIRDFPSDAVYELLSDSD